MCPMVAPILDDTLVVCSRVSRDRIRRTVFARDAVRGGLPLESYATSLRALGSVVRALEGTLARQVTLSAFSHTGLEMRHAVTRDLTVVSGFSRAFPVAASVWRNRLERLSSQPELLVAHLAVFHLDCPLSADDVVAGISRSTGLSAARGVEALSVDRRAKPSARLAWDAAVRGLAADRPMRVAMIAEANMACALLEQVLDEVHGYSGSPSAPPEPVES